MKPLSILALALLCCVLQVATASADNHWHTSTYRAEYIDGHGHGNHALYCGDETIPACDPPDTVGGVGRDWFDDVEWIAPVADPRRPVTVRLTGLMNVDLPDAGWDFLELYVQRADELDLLESWTGSYDTTLTIDHSASLAPEELSGPGGDQVRLVWRVWTSLDGWDDEDCISPSHGACQIDDLAVYLDGELVTFDDFEPGNPMHWEPVIDGITATDEVPGNGQVTLTAYPNPFNPRTTIEFELPRASRVTLAIYDLHGRLVRELLPGQQLAAGRHQQVWDGRDDQGLGAATGTYVYRFTAGRQSWSRKLTMLK